MGQRIFRSDLGLQCASCLDPKRRTVAGQYSSSHRCAPAGHLRADGNDSQVRLRTAAACANGARSTAVACRDGRSHKRSGGTSTKLLASVPFDPSVGAIGVDLAASLGQHAPRRCGPTTFLHLVFPKNENKLSPFFGLSEIEYIDSSRNLALLSSSGLRLQ